MKNKISNDMLYKYNRALISATIILAFGVVRSAVFDSFNKFIYFFDTIFILLFLFFLAYMFREFKIINWIKDVMLGTRKF